MAENDPGPLDDEADASEARAPRRGRARPVLAVAALIPLAAAVGAVSVSPPPETTAVTRAETRSQPGPSTLRCPGPLQIPEGLFTGGADDELALTPPSDSIGLNSVALETDSSLLFGTVSGSETQQQADGSARAPSLTTVDGDGSTLEDATAASTLGVGVQTLGEIEQTPSVQAAAAEGSRPVADAVQSSVTTSGDFRSLALSRCEEPTTDASFLGVSTARGDSSVLVLHNPTQRPATASVQIWTEDGPAPMEGRSQVTVAPGGEERVLLESVAGGHDAIGVHASVLGAPLSMHVQTTQRDGLTPGGAEILSPLPSAAVEQVLPGLEVTGGTPTVVLANPRGADTTASIEVTGPDGPVADAAEDVDVPAGAVVPVPLPSLADGAYSVSVRSQDPVLAVARTAATGQDLPGDTVAAPVDFALVSPAPALSTSGLLALPPEGAVGALTLAATEDASVTVVPIGADGTAGTPVEVDLDAGTSGVVPWQELAIDSMRTRALTVVPSTPGAVHAGWMQREDDGNGGDLISSLPVPSAQLDAETLTVRLTE
ncbi:DUF5719 family protein [Brachybacterium fresconis]|uniref:Secreted protein n=1 Tax=Brachybacterium fresconis TaxID=173363 RepID=A0ABS4YHC1_9MICO|nr:DUF5719 family protein [Brachybacterium fresconis]MBP2408191.1 hypothetical protein [Brachybacterium fresconis]